MDFDFSSEQKLIQDSTRKIFSKFYPTEEIRSFADNQVIDKQFIKTVAENGLFGIITNSELGQNLGLTDALPIFIEAGHSLIPFPLMENIIGAKVLSDAGRELSSSIIQGETLITISWSGMGQGVFKNNSGKISGSFEKVPFAEHCEWLLIPVTTNDFNKFDSQISLILINTKNKNVTLQKQDGIDLTYPIYKVEIRDYNIDLNNIIGNFGEGQIIYDDIKNIGSIFTSAEMFGASQASLTKTIQYTKERAQFGQKIAQFQSLKHIAADRYVDVVSELAAVQYAAWEYDAKQQHFPLSIAVAKAFNSETSLRIVEDSIQLQGGIGYTWENELHLYLKRVLRLAYIIGNPNYYREMIAQRILD